MPELRVPGPRSVALQAARLERDSGGFRRAKADGMERGARQAGGFIAKSAGVAAQAGGLKREHARRRDPAPCR